MTATVELKNKVRDYWDSHIHDLAVVKHSVGTLGFFDDLDEYRFDKLRYLPRLVDFKAYAGQTILEVGCGTGIDLARFAQGGAAVTGVDLSKTAIDLAKKNFDLRRLKGAFHIMDGEKLQFEDNSFDVVYGHGVLQYTANPVEMVKEMHRVLKPGGMAVFMVYNRLSWLNALSKIMKTPLEHEDAPVLRKISIGEFRKWLAPFSKIQVVPERFPVRSRLHGGLKGFLFNNVFVGTFNLIPRPVVRPLGWHLMAFCKK